jgi:pilus assembly protein CpaF
MKATKKANEPFRAFQLLTQHSVLFSQEKPMSTQHPIIRIANIDFDFGVITPYIIDESVMEIMIARYDTIYIEQKGKLIETGVSFGSEEALMVFIQHIADQLGRTVDEMTPMFDMMFPNSRLLMNVVLRPVAAHGPTVTLRKFATNPLKMEDLLRFGAITPDIVTFLKACIQTQLNMVICGGTGSGKTTVYNIVAGFIPEDERIVTVERQLELQLMQKHVIPLVARPANADGKGEIAMRDLLVNALKMRPDRILAGEVHGGEVVDIVQAMKTGHNGSMLSLHAESSRDALARLEVMYTMGLPDMPLNRIREDLATAIDIIVHQQRLRDGKRKIMAVTEIMGMEGQFIKTQDIFTFEQTDVQDGKIIGTISPTGNVPRCGAAMKDAGITFPEDFFNPNNP